MDASAVFILLTRIVSTLTASAIVGIDREFAFIEFMLSG
jgi:hypothetical protein